MRVLISNRSCVPIYEQIKQQLREAILSGELKEGFLLPSIRELARDLKISVITTARAYGDLEQEGFVASVQGKGSYVLAKNKELAHENALRRVEEALAAAILAAKAGAIQAAEFQAALALLCKEEGYE